MEAKNHTKICPQPTNNGSTPGKQRRILELLSLTPLKGSLAMAGYRLLSLTPLMGSIDKKKTVTWNTRNTNNTQTQPS